VNWIAVTTAPLLDVACTTLGRALGGKYWVQSARGALSCATSTRAVGDEGPLRRAVGLHALEGSGQ
jgi:hypothetical protein